MENVISMIAVGFMLAALFALACKCESDYQEEKERDR
jgi:hypothetical protein